MFWKIYFFVFLVGTIFGILSNYTNRSSTSTDILEVILLVLIALGIYAYAFAKKIFTPVFWQWFFYLLALGLTLEFLYKFANFTLLSDVLESKGVTTTSELIITTIFILPAFYAIYLLGKSSKKK